MRKYCKDGMKQICQLAIAYELLDKIKSIMT